MTRSVSVLLSCLWPLLTLHVPSLGHPSTSTKPSRLDLQASSFKSKSNCCEIVVSPRPLLIVRTHSLSFSAGIQDSVSKARHFKLIYAETGQHTAKTQVRICNLPRSQAYEILRLLVTL